LLDVVERVDLPGVNDKLFRERLGELDRGKCGLVVRDVRMGPANIHRHDCSGCGVHGIAVNGFAAEGDEEAWPQPGLLTVYVQPIVVATAELKGLLQPAAG